jgi:hypothetical protein
MPITYAPARVNYGFDAAAMPKWQMVPVGGERVLNVSGVGGRQIRVRDTSILSATFTGKSGKGSLKLKGLKAGKTFVEWVPDAGYTGPLRDKNLLEVSVKAEKKVRTAFHYVKDNAGHKTARKKGDLGKLIQNINAILTPQSNVKIEKKSAGDVTVPQDLGAVVRFVESRLRAAPHNVPATEHEWDDVTKFADSSADFNMFFVWKYEQDATPNVNNARAGTLASEKNCLADDVISNSAETLAHETIHLLGISAHSTDSTHLIGTGRTDRKITRGQANQINPSGT